MHLLSSFVLNPFSKTPFDLPPTSSASNTERLLSTLHKYLDPNTPNWCAMPLLTARSVVERKHEKVTGVKWIGVAETCISVNATDLGVGGDVELVQWTNSLPGVGLQIQRRTDSTAIFGLRNIAEKLYPGTEGL
jgi:hypothetical protein